MATDKEVIRDAILALKAKKIIKFDSDVAAALGYSRGAISEILNPDSGKPVTYAFKQKFKEKFGKYLSDMPQENEMEYLKAWLDVLKDTCVSLLSISTGKTHALISAELEEAVRLKKK